MDNRSQGKLTDKEWKELLGLDYLINFNHTGNNSDKIMERYNELIDKKDKK